MSTTKHNSFFAALLYFLYGLFGDELVRKEHLGICVYLLKIHPALESDSYDTHVIKYSSTAPAFLKVQRLCAQISDIVVECS